MKKQISLLEPSVEERYMVELNSQLTMYARNFSGLNSAIVVDKVSNPNGLYKLFIKHSGLLLTDGRVIDAKFIYDSPNSLLESVSKSTEIYGKLEIILGKRAYNLLYLDLKTKPTLHDIFSNNRHLDILKKYMTYIKTNFGFSVYTISDRIINNQRPRYENMIIKRKKMWERNNFYLQKLFINHPNHKILTTTNLKESIDCVWLPLNKKDTLVITQTSAYILYGDKFKIIYILGQKTVIQCVNALKKIIKEYSLDDNLLEFPKNMSLRYKQV